MACVLERLTHFFGLIRMRVPRTAPGSSARCNEQDMQGHVQRMCFLLILVRAT